jgi:hypothetical protein
MRPSLGGGAGISQTVRHPSSISATPTFPARFDGKPPKIASSLLFGGHLKTEGVIWPYPFSFGTFEKKGDLANRSDAANTRVDSHAVACGRRRAGSNAGRYPHKIWPHCELDRGVRHQASICAPYKALEGADMGNAHVGS